MTRKRIRRRRDNPLYDTINYMETHDWARKVGGVLKRVLQSAGLKLVPSMSIFGCQHRIGGFDTPSICQLDPGKRECNLPIAPNWCPLSAECKECGHSRDEHCGCGMHCLAPINEDERKKTEGTGSWKPCECSGWKPKIQS